MEIYKQIKPDFDIVIVDYMDKLIDDRNSYKDVQYLKMTKLANDLFFNILSTVYDVDKNMLDKFKDVYGKYPSTPNFQNNEKTVIRDKNRMFNLIRSLKINKIRKCI